LQERLAQGVGGGAGDGDQSLVASELFAHGAGGKPLEQRLELRFIEIEQPCRDDLAGDQLGQGRIRTRANRAEELRRGGIVVDRRAQRFGERAQALNLGIFSVVPGLRRFHLDQNEQVIHAAEVFHHRLERGPESASSPSIRCSEASGRICITAAAEHIASARAITSVATGWRAGAPRSLHRRGQEMGAPVTVASPPPRAGRTAHREDRRSVRHYPDQA